GAVRAGLAALAWCDDHFRAVVWRDRRRLGVDDRTLCAAISPLRSPAEPRDRRDRCRKPARRGAGGRRSDAPERRFLRYLPRTRIDWQPRRDLTDGKR